MFSLFRILLYISSAERVGAVLPPCGVGWDPDIKYVSVPYKYNKYKIEGTGVGYSNKLSYSIACQGANIIGGVAWM